MDKIKYISSEKYSFKKILSFGSDGSVLLAVNNTTKKNVAIKVVFITDDNDTELGALLNEYNLFASLQLVDKNCKKGMACYYEIGKIQPTKEFVKLVKKEINENEDDCSEEICQIAAYDSPKNVPDMLCLVMEFIEDGYDLETLCKNCPEVFTDKTILQIALRIGKILKMLHKYNIIHGDLAARNIMFSKGRIILIDFGRSCTTMTRSKVVEQCDDETIYTDLAKLAAIIHSFKIRECEQNRHINFKSRSQHIKNGPIKDIVRYIFSIETQKKPEPMKLVCTKIKETLKTMKD